MGNFLAIDQGTTSSRAIVFNSNLNALVDSQKEYKLSYPKDGWVEADPADILRTVNNTVSDVLKKENAITACGITNQRESTVVWSRETGEPIYPAIIWQDRRTHEFCKELREPPESAKISREEIFGPVICVYGYDDIDLAIEQANALPYAFQAAVFSDRLSIANHCIQSLAGSAVMVNDHTAFRVDWMPFAGLRRSGLGVGGIPYTMADMSIEKMAVWNWPAAAS